MERPKAQKEAVRLQRTAICCSFRGVPQVHRCWASRFPRSRPRADWATLGGARKLQQIGVRLRGDVCAVAKRRLCCGKSAFVCGASFARLRNDVCAEENRRLFHPADVRPTRLALVPRQRLPHLIDACGVISRKQTRAMRCGRGNPLSGRIAGARTHPRACPAPRLRRRP